MSSMQKISTLSTLDIQEQSMFTSATTTMQQVFSDAQVDFVTRPLSAYTQNYPRAINSYVIKVADEEVDAVIAELSADESIEYVESCAYEAIALVDYNDPKS